MKKENEVEEEKLETEVNEETQATDESTEQLQEKYDASQKEVEELKDKLLRRQAEFENFKKRTQKEKEAIVTYASEGLVTDLLPSLDSFERALEVEVDEDDEKSKALYEGLELVYNQLIEVLKNNGLQQIECVNEKFDHNCHHAVVQQESEDHEADTVIQELGKGYKYKEKVIRPSMVMVSK